MLREKTANITTNGTLPFDPHGPAPGFMGTLAWTDYLRFTLIIVNASAGSFLNGFILWVLKQAPNLKPLEIIQMNQAAFDLIDAIFGHACDIAARVAVTKDAFLGAVIFHVDLLLLMIGITLEDLMTIFLSILRTKQVNRMTDTRSVKQANRQIGKEKKKI